MGKVKVSREVAECIESYIFYVSQGIRENEEMAKSNLVFYHVRRLWENYEGGKFSSINEINFSDLMNFLANGYEIEETPEEKLLNEFNNAIQTANRKIPGTFDDGYWTGLKDGIYETLEIKKEKIKGIND